MSADDFDDIVRDAMSEGKCYWSREEVEEIAREVATEEELRHIIVSSVETSAPLTRESIAAGIRAMIRIPLDPWEGDLEDME